MVLLERELESDEPDELRSDIRRIPPEFFAALRELHKTLGPAGLDERVCTLAAILDNMRGNQVARREAFARDLAEAFRSIADREFPFESLEGKLRKWRADVTAYTIERVSRLHRDDPVFCPISLFGVFDHGRLEVAHTRALAWILNPQNEHGFGNVFAQSLLESIVHEDGFGPVTVEEVRSERDVGHGRIDVLVRGFWETLDGKPVPWMLMLEAKVDASESDGQLQKYDDWAKRNADGRRVLRIFLTPDGRDATSSGDDSPSTSWTPMSFLELVCNFRIALRAVKKSAGYHFGRYYLSGVMKDICRWSLPLCDPRTAVDPYSLADYLRAISQAEGDDNGVAQ